MPRLSTRRKELLTQITKEAIFEAATLVLSQHGTSGLTMDRVAAAARLAKGSLYNYFSSKDDLIGFVLARIVEPIGEAVAEISHGELPARTKLEAVLRVLFEHIAQNRGVLGVLIRDDAGRDARESSMQSAHEAATGHFATIFRQGITEGVFRAFDPVLGAEVLLAALDKVFKARLLAAQPQPVEETVQGLMSLILHGVAAGESRGPRIDAGSVN
jgi:TetR/AcrR family fatty acid metabolism transcriptional regulator